MDPVVYWFLPVVAAHLVLGYVLYRLLRTTADATDDGSERSGDTTASVGADDRGFVDRDDGTVVCPSCGTANELGYTYCYDCIDELPGAASRTSSGLAPGRRGVR